MKKKTNQLVKILLWYNFIIIGVSVMIYFINLLTLVDESLKVIVFNLFLLFFNIALLIIVIKQLFSKLTVIGVNFLLFFWLLQVFSFNFEIIEFTFSNGPMALVYLWLEEPMKMGFINKLWSQEFAFNINVTQGKYLGLNFVALIISIGHGYLRQVIKKKLEKFKN